MHCFSELVDLDDPKNYVIVGAGIHDLCADAQVASEFWQLSHVKKIHHTGDFDPNSFNNDLAILELSKDLKLNDIIQPICLPSKQFLPGELCFVSGWGHDQSKIIPRQVYI